MDNDIRAKLEAAAAVIMAPPNQIKPEARQEAEAVFMQFRNNKSLDALQLCQTILETSTVDLVIFECINIIKSILISSWDLIQDDVKMNLRQYLLNFVLQHKHAPFFIREKILQVVSIMIKRTSLVDHGADRHQILEQAKAMFLTDDATQITLASALVLAVLREHTECVKSEDTGLTFDHHFKAKKMFETSELRSVFTTVLEAMARTIQNAENIDAVIGNQLARYLEIMEIILTWGYISPVMPKRLISMIETVSKINQNVALRLNLSWEPIIFDPKMLQTFFYLYWKVRQVPDLRQKGLVCLVQLSTLSGPVLTSKKETRLMYLKNYLSHLSQLLGNETCVEEIVGFSLIIRKLLLFHGAAMDLREDSVDVFNGFIEKLFNITIKCIEATALEETEESSLFMEAFENNLESWVLLLQSKEDLPTDFLSQFVIQIFNKYVQAHLSPPEGIRMNDSDHEEFTEDTEKDRVRYKEQLVIIGTFAREVIAHSLPILAKLLEDKIRTFAVMLQTLYTANVNITEKETTALQNIFEDIHWLLLLTAYTIGNDSEGETALIPPEINQYCQARFQTGTIDINKSLELIAKPDKDIAEIFQDPEQADPILRITASMLRLAELESTALKCQMGTLLSPELSSTLMFFMRIWLSIYLFPLPEYYETICESVKVAFGIDSECGKWILNYILTKVCANIQQFASENDVIEDTVQVFLAILKQKHKCLPVYNSEVFNTLFGIKDMKLPVTAKRGLLKGFVQIAGSISDATTRKSYLSQIFAPIAARYFNILHKPDLKATYQNEDIKLEVISIIEEVRGCVLGAYNLISSSLFEHFQVMFVELPELLNLYRNYNVIVELLLELLCETVLNIDYASDTADVSLKTGIYNCCMSIIRVWVSVNANKISTEMKDYDDCPEDILLILKLLTCLLSKTLIDDDADAPVDAGQVVIYGLTSLMPLISMDLIRFPAFCNQYYQTIAVFAESKSHKITTLDPELLKQIISSVQLGLNTFTTEIQSFCFDFIVAVSDVVYYERIPNSVTYNLVLPFLELIFNMIVTRQIDAENKNESYGAVFSLACAFKEQFSFLMNKLVTSQENPQIAERIQLKLNEFQTGLELNNNRIQRTKFIEKFDKFITGISFILNNA
ncbi:exportin-4-like [Culicoides brevitarsis]|uniref:exportin-4-like n=1 Tax=Culicoides brevitarsis TaxID=469753 RepID=UPI00307B29BD